MNMDEQVTASTEEGMEQPDTKVYPKQSHSAAIRNSLDQQNLAEELSEEKLGKIAGMCIAGFESDMESRQPWEQQMEEWTKLAIQTREKKTYPWPNASNIKYPLLSTAAMQFAARAYPSLVPSNGQIVKSRVIGKDKDGEKTNQSIRVSQFMSWQVMNEMDNWEEDMDKLLMMLPILGTVFKKTYWDPTTKANCSRLVYPKNLVVNYWARSLESSERISEIIELSPRQVAERQRSGIFLDVELGESVAPRENSRIEKNNIPRNDETTPHEFIEQHTFLCLNDDDDESTEDEKNDVDDRQLPYIVTIHRASGKIVRISPRYDETSFVLGGDDGTEILSISPIQYYTKFGFVPNPDGGFYDLGFGMLLGPINESVNTIVNQLVDAGSLSNLQSGFIGKGLRIRMGEQRFQPGEWKAVNSTADDLKKQIFPLPTREPSNVLFQLMGSLITSGKELASVAEIFVGKTPGQNTPATTTMATIEQGMKVFTAVYKRLYRALGSEFRKLYRLNEVYLDLDTYSEVLDDVVNPSDFKGGTYNIVPGADPSAVSQTEKLLKAQGLMELLPTGLLDPVLVVQRILEAQEQPNWEQLIAKAVQQSGKPPEPPPDPKVIALQEKGKLEQQKLQMQAQSKAQDQELAQRDQAAKQAMAQQALAIKAQESQDKIAVEAQIANQTLQAKLAESKVNMQTKALDAAQNAQHREQQHQQQLRHREEQSKSTQSQQKSSKTGKTRK